MSHHKYRHLLIQTYSSPSSLFVVHIPSYLFIALEMLYFTFILIELLCPCQSIIPEVKNKLNICTLSLLIQRKILPIWFLFKSYFCTKTEEQACTPKGIEAIKPCARLSDCATYIYSRYETVLSPTECNLYPLPKPPHWWRCLSLYRCQGWHFQTSS